MSADTDAVIDPDRLREGVGGASSLGDNEGSVEGDSRTERPQGRMMARAGGVSAGLSDGTGGVDAETQAEDDCAPVEVELLPCRLETPKRLDTRRNALEAEMTVFERLRTRPGVAPATSGGLVE